MVTIIQPAGIPIGVMATVIASATVARQAPAAVVLRSLFRAPAREQQRVATLGAPSKRVNA